jgi:hypothetical protein
MGTDPYIEVMKRATVVLGAGGVLDFDFSNITFPSTQNITNKIVNLKVQGLYQEQSEIISAIYKKIKETGDQIYIQRDLHRQFKYQVNFEELFFVLESLYSFNGTFQGEYLFPEIRPLIASLVKPIDEIQHYPSIEYYRALYAITKAIIEIIDEYDAKFLHDANNEVWYRKFWSDVPSRWDIFTFNYDNTIENSLKEYEDGFEPSCDGGNYEHFNPVKLITNPYNLSTIHHLHGCTRYSELNPKTYKWVHSHRDMYKVQSVDDAIKYLDIQSSPSNQANERYFHSPIIIGLRKLDKLTFLPFSIYHANLVNKIIANPSLFIVGYSFGDLYANQLIERHSLIHGNQQRVVLIDKFPQYIESPSQLYRYLSDNISSGAQQFLKCQMKYHISDDLKIKGLNIVKYDLPIYSDDGRFMLLICGFKKAVENHKKTIIDFLM